jgi:hypothetical protein
MVPATDKLLVNFLLAAILGLGLRGSSEREKEKSLMIIYYSSTTRRSSGVLVIQQRLLHGAINAQHPQAPPLSANSQSCIVRPPEERLDTGQASFEERFAAAALRDSEYFLHRNDF